MCIEVLHLEFSADTPEVISPADVHALLGARQPSGGPFQPRLEFEESHFQSRSGHFLSYHGSSVGGHSWQILGPGDVDLGGELPSLHGRFGGVAGRLLAAARGRRLCPACAQSRACGRDCQATESRWGGGCRGGAGARGWFQGLTLMGGCRLSPGCGCRSVGQPLVLGGTAAPDPAFGVTGVRMARLTAVLTSMWEASVFPLSSRAV